MLNNFPVMPQRCATCPFNVDASGRHENPDLVSKIIATVVTDASHLCHHPRLSGHQETHLCRGARDYQQTIFYRLGVIAAPTDAAWQEKLAETDF